MLKAPVDLLWNGGIGTYVKARSESHADVGDRANDVVRVNGDELRCRIVGEGGNLGLTQLGRIEYAAHGGRVNTDAIDNSGGVDCSDHEVNIKVLLNEVVSGGDMTDKQRNALLEEMTDEVGDLVLRNNYLQTQALAVAESQAASLLEVHSPTHPPARARRGARPRDRVPARGGGARRAPRGRGGAPHARALGADRLRQDRPVPGACSTPRCRTSRSW